MIRLSFWHILWLQEGVSEEARVRISLYIKEFFFLYKGVCMYVCVIFAQTIKTTTCCLNNKNNNL